MSINYSILRLLPRSRLSNLSIYGKVNSLCCSTRKYSTTSLYTSNPSAVSPNLLKNHGINALQQRFKKVKRSSPSNEKEDDESSDDEDESTENPLLLDEDKPTSDGSEKVVLDIGSLRLDAFAKVAFGTTRAKIEELFYKGDIIVNGERPPKKSYDLSINDEIDLIKQVNVEDRSKLDVRRVQIVKLPDKTSEHGRMKVTIKRWSDLTIDAYDDKYQ